jgi:hypothetical protein
MLTGEPGIGKTRLLEHAATAAADLTVIWLAGFESETQLGFGALHRLLRPFLDRLSRLPAPQRDALHAASGLSGIGPPDRYLIGLATLTMLSGIAAEQPVVYLVDDVQAGGHGRSWRIRVNYPLARGRDRLVLNAADQHGQLHWSGKCSEFETDLGAAVVRQPEKVQVSQDQHVTRSETLHVTAHKDVYETVVLSAMKAIPAELASEFGDGKVFRPNRDVRFSTGKSRTRRTSEPPSVPAIGTAG